MIEKTIKKLREVLLSENDEENIVMSYFSLPFIVILVMQSHWIIEIILDFLSLILVFMIGYPCVLMIYEIITGKEIFK